MWPCRFPRVGIGSVTWMRSGLLENKEVLHGPFFSLARGLCADVHLPAQTRLERLGKEELQFAAHSLIHRGYAVLRQNSLYTAAELEIAQASADGELHRVKERTEELGLLDKAPWLPLNRHMKDAGDYEFSEAISYSSGRLDLPSLIESEPFNELPWRDHPDMHKLCRELFGCACTQSIIGALWSFPGSSDTGWHRDGEEPLLVAVTAMQDYPCDIGWIRVQPFTHARGMSRTSAIGRLQQGPAFAPAVPVALRQGETLLFMYTTIHAGGPNLTQVDRCLLYTVYGPLGVQDSTNHKPSFPSLFH